MMLWKSNIYDGAWNNIKSKSTFAEEVCFIGTGHWWWVCQNTNELHVMKYNEAMQTKDVKQWHDAVEDEYHRMTKHEVFEVVPIEEVPEDATVSNINMGNEKES
jgi:hypothetical protein